MTRKDLFRLAKISLASRKKSTKSTVRGIAFGLILLIPVLFIALGIFGDLNKKVDANPEVLFLNVSGAAARSAQGDVTGENYYSPYNTAIAGVHIENIAKNVKDKEVIYYEQVKAPFNPYMVSKFESDNGRYPVFGIKFGEEELQVCLKSNYDYGGGNYYGNGNNEAYSRNSTDVPFAAIIDTEKTRASSIYTKKIVDKFGDVFVSGMNEGFTGNGKGQVVLSERFIKSLGRSASEFYGKKFSVIYEESGGSGYQYTYINPDTEVIEDYIEQGETFNETYGGVTKTIYFCNEYKVVGVIKDEVTTYAMDTYGNGSDYSPSHIMTNMMFFTSASLITDEGETLEPVIRSLSPESDDDNGNRGSSYNMATYTRDPVEFETLNKEYIAYGATGFNSFKFQNGYYYGSDDAEIIHPYPTANVFVDPMKFSALDAAVSTVKSELNAVLGDEAESFVRMVTGSVYSELSMVYSAFTYVVLVFAIMGGIIFFASMVNLFNSIVHSVDSRKSYLGVLRAVGAKRSLINKMYMAESLTIFKRALIWILIFATVICVGITLLLNMVIFSYLNESPMMPFKLAVSYVYIPIALAIALAVLVILGFAFSYGCSWKVSRDPITKTLAG